MSVSIDEIAPASGDAWKPEIGESVKGVITYVGTFTGDSYDKTKTERKLRVDLDTETGDAVTIWATMSTDINGDGFPKRDARAIADAVRASGADKIEVGGELGMRRGDDTPTDFGPAKTFQAQYRPPAPTTPAVGADEASSGAVDDLLG